jgi:hypothetical protein
METNELTRRDYLKLLGAGAVSASAAGSLTAGADETTDQTRRLKWWREAKFGMFIH